MATDNLTWDDDDIQTVFIPDPTPRPLYVRRDVLNQAEIKSFYTFHTLDDMHVTLAYSKQPVDWTLIGRRSSPITIGGGFRHMQRFGDATVLALTSRRLSARHNYLRRMGLSHDFPTYQPHLTLSYDPSLDTTTILPYAGDIVLGPEIFEEINGS